MTDEQRELFIATLRRRIERWEEDAPRWFLDAMNIDGGPLIWGDATTEEP